MPKFYAEVPKGYIGAVAVAQADSREHALELINRVQREAGDKEVQLAQLSEAKPLALTM